MKPLRIRKRVSEAETTTVAAAAAASTSAGTGGGTAPSAGSSSEPPALIPSPPPARPGQAEESTLAPAGRPSSGASTASLRSSRAASPPHGAVKFASELDNANVEAYLEYLTHPHTSWESATRHLAHRREVIDNHRASVFARSLASSRHSSFASTMRSEGGVEKDPLEASVSSSVASAPAGFPRTASNSSKTQTGTLRKGRLGDTSGAPPAPPNLVATGSGATTAATPAAASVPSSQHGGLPPSRTASSHSTAGTGQRAASNKGRLSRGNALAAPRPTRASAPPSASAGKTAASGPDLMVVGGTHLQTGSTNLSVGVGPSSAGTGRSMSRDGAAGCINVKGKRKVGSA